MKDPIFYTKDGKLTAYALACGYVEKDITEANVKMMFMEHNHYHVKHGQNGTKLNWETFDKLSEARKYYNSIKLNKKP